MEGDGGDDVVSGREIARVVSWVEGVLADAFETEVTVVLVEVNEALAVAVGTRAPLLFINTILALVSKEAGAGVGVGKGCEVPTTLVDVGASLSFTNTILTLVSTRASVKAGTKAAKEIEGALLGPGTDVSMAGEAPTAFIGARVREIPECAA